MGALKPLPLKSLRRSIKILIVVSFGLMLVAWKQKAILPEDEQLDERLYQEPQQGRQSYRPFDFDYMGKNYVVLPQADYELWGLVVTHNDIHSITDMYHDFRSVDIKDICVIWGDNLYNDLYTNSKFWSAPWTCFWRTENREVFEEFNVNQISNNHLLSDDPKVRETIKNVNVGDQIRVKGMLVNYVPRDNLRMLRETSLIRSDTGQGACEVLFVEDFEVLKASRPGWYSLYKFSRLALYILVALVPILFVYAILLENKGKRLR